MLILLGGFQGSGKRRLARDLAAATGFFWHDASRPQVIPSAGDFEEKIPSVISDHARVLRATKISSDFGRLSAQYDGVVIEYMMHRRVPREYLITEAAKQFSEVIQVWIDSDERSVMRRLSETTGGGEALDRAIREREYDMREFEPFEPVIPVFSYSADDPDALSGLIRVIEQVVGRTITRSR